MNASRNYRRRPDQIEAMYWDGTAETTGAVLFWIRKNGGQAEFCDAPLSLAGPGRGVTTVTRRIEVITRNEVSMAFPGEWILRDADGEFSALPEKRFEKLYEAVPRPPRNPDIVQVYQDATEWWR